MGSFNTDLGRPETETLSSSIIQYRLEISRSDVVGARSEELGRDSQTVSSTV